MIKESSNGHSRFSVVILAGGNASRMKFPKPWLKINDTTFLEKIIETYQNFGIHNIIVVINQKFCIKQWENMFQSIKDKAIVVENIEVEKGRLYSLKLGLQKIVDADFIYIQNIDNPFIDESILETLAQYKCENGVTVPTFQGKGGHPILIHKVIAAQIINNFESDSTLHDIINQFDRKNVGVENESILMNINTPEDYQKVLNELE